VDLALFFFLPLLGGVSFSLSFCVTSYQAARQDTQRLYYRAATVGILFSLLGLGIHHTLLDWPAYKAGAATLDATFIRPLLDLPSKSAAAAPAKALDAQEKEVLAAQSGVAFACLWALVIGVLSGRLLNHLVSLYDNWRFGQDSSNPRLRLRNRINLRSITDQFELLLFEAQIDTRQIQVTLSNQKVYTGWVNESVDPKDPQKYFRLQPSMSGYRSSATQEIVFTTFYDKVLSQYLAGDARAERLRSYEVVIPIAQVISASGFDPSAYVEFQKSAAPAAKKGFFNRVRS
jgi:hypothetical protein